MIIDELGIIMLIGFIVAIITIATYYIRKHITNEIIKEIKERLAIIGLILFIVFMPAISTMFFVVGLIVTFNGEETLSKVMALVILGFSFTVMYAKSVTGINKNTDWLAT